MPVGTAGTIKGVTPDQVRAEVEREMAILKPGGGYICGPDVGTTPEDMVTIGETTDHVRGRPGESGDTSPATGYGVFQALRAAVRQRLGRQDLAGLKVAVQGAGAVGAPQHGGVPCGGGRAEAARHRHSWFMEELELEEKAAREAASGATLGRAG